MIEPVLHAFGEADEYQARIDVARAEQDYETMAALYRGVQSQSWLHRC
jgi:cob(I)alamin adenosyltransferase